MNMHSFFFSLLILWMAINPYQVYSKTLVLEGSPKSSYQLGPYLDILEDANGLITIDEIRSGKFDSHFVTNTKAIPNFGHSKKAYWIRINVLNNIEINTMPWVLNIDFALIDSVDFYHYCSKNEPEKIIHTGMLRPFDSRKYDFYNFVFPVEMHKSGMNVFYLRIRSSASLTLPITLYTIPGFVSYSYYKQLLQGIYFGILFIMLIYNLFLAISLKDRSYFYFSLSIFALGFYLLAYSGIGFQYIWPNSTVINTFAVPFFTALMMYSFLNYTDHFLQLKKNCPTCHQIIMWIVTGHVIFMIFIPIVGYELSIRPMMLLTLAETVILILFLIIEQKKGNRASRYFLFSSLSLAPGIVVFILVRFGILSSTSISETSFKISTVLFLLLMSLALAERIKESEREQDKSEQRFRLIVETSIDLIWEADEYQRFTYVSPNSQSILEYEPEELINHTIYDFMDPQKAKVLKGEIHSFVEKLQSNFSIQIPVISATGRNILFERRCSVFYDKNDKVHKFRGIDRDITERKRSEQIQQMMYTISNAASTTHKLTDLYKVIHTELNKLFDATNLIIAFYNESEEALQVSYLKDQFDQYTKFSISKSISGQVLIYNQPMLLKEKELKELAEKIGPIGTLSKIWMGVPLQDEGKAIGVLVVQSYNDPNAYTMDDLELLGFVSKQISVSINKKKAEETLKKSEENFRLIFNNAATGIAVLNTDGFFQFVNNRLCEITGYSEKKLLSMSYLQMVHRDDTQTFKEDIVRLISGKVKMVSGEHKLIHKNGNERWVELSMSTRFTEIGELDAIIAVIYDITEQHYLHNQLVQTQKMETIGTMAGGIAHDFNNILTVINGYSEIANMKLEADHPVHKYLEAIKSAGDRAENLTRQILAFSRKQMYQPVNLDLNSLLLELEKMIRRLIGENIQINFELASKLPFIKADPNQLEQVVINLIVNARDALLACKDQKRKKQIRVQTGMRIADQNFSKQFAVPHAKEYVWFSVYDTGIGMEENIKQKIFEPFFTTKAKGKGTGLGLAMVYGIVNQNQAIIKVDSEPEQGTTITIYWAADETANLDMVKIEQNPKELKGSEHILLVEDEEDVRRFASNALLELGYRVETASNGKEALKMIERSEFPFDLVFTDVIMPEMSGKELADQLSVLYPELPVLFASGYTDNELVHEGEIENNINFIYKPYSVQTILTRIRSLLDRTVANT